MPEFARMRKHTEEQLAETKALERAEALRQDFASGLLQYEENTDLTDRAPRTIGDLVAAKYREWVESLGTEFDPGLFDFSNLD